MYTIKGQILEINEIKKEKTHKYEVTIVQPDNNECYIEFRGRVMMDVLKPFSVGEYVAINHIIEGKISRSECKFNNLVARSIKTI